MVSPSLFWNKVWNVYLPLRWVTNFCCPFPRDLMIFWLHLSQSHRFKLSSVRDAILSVFCLKYGPNTAIVGGITKTGWTCSQAPWEAGFCFAVAFINQQSVATQNYLKSLRLLQCSHSPRLCLVPVSKSNETLFDSGSPAMGKQLVAWQAKPCWYEHSHCASRTSIAVHRVGDAWMSQLLWVWRFEEHEIIFHRGATPTMTSSWLHKAARFFRTCLMETRKSGSRLCVSQGSLGSQFLHSDGSIFGQPCFNRNWSLGDNWWMRWNSCTRLLNKHTGE